MRRTLSLAAFGAAGLLALSLTAGPSATADQPDDTESYATLDQAVAALAADMGVSVSELKSDANEQNDFAIAATEVEEAFPDDFAGAAVTAGVPTITFKGVAPSKVREMLSMVGTPVAIIENVGWSQAEISKVGEAAHYAIYDLVGTGTSTDINTFTGEILVTVPVGATAEAATALQTAIPAVRSFDIQIRASNEFRSGQDIIYGGAALSTCTSGYSVSASGFPHGIITAGHCSNSQTYLTGSVPLSFRTASTSRDVQWHSSSTAAGPQFYVGAGSLRNVTGKANPVVGQTLCKYGKTTGYTCSTTYVDNQCRDTYCDMMTMTNRLADGGDSGGPVFWSTTAYGVHSGWIPLNGADRDMFTPINSGLSALGISLKLF